jgi:hypothetical protein
MLNIHHYYHPDQATAERLKRIDETLGRMESKMAIDTSALLAAVAQERTELASWKALAAAQTKALQDAAAALAAANAAGDPAAQAAVQADLDKAASDLSSDNADAASAIAANTPAASGNATPSSG